MRSWVIGSSTDCDVVVDSPLASGRHCQLTETPDGLMVDDLGSTNGTYVNGTKVAGPIRLTARDTVTLGRTVPFPWPPELTTSIRIGRLADNDIVVDDARVSGHHARLIVVTGYRTTIEDTGSSNGTFLNSPDRRVTAPTPITASDTLFFGTLAVPAVQLLRSPASWEAPAPARAPESPRSREPRHEPVVPPTVLAFVQHHRWQLSWLAQAPVLAIVIVLLFGRQPAAAAFALALAALWMGGSLAMVGGTTRRTPGREASIDLGSSWISFGKRLALMTLICSGASAGLTVVVHRGSGLEGSGAAMGGVVALTSLVGLFLGLAVSGTVRNLAAAASVLLTAFLAMLALGGSIWTLPEMTSPTRSLANAMPSRWAFEGLLLLQTANHSAPATAEPTENAPDNGLVERFFPASSERMGVLADSLALGSMLIGLLAMILFRAAGKATAP